MRDHSSATTIGRKAVGLLKTARRLWDEGVRVNEILLGGPWDHEGPARWRRRHDGWTLEGSTPPLAPLDHEPEIEPVSPRSGSSSC